MSVENMKEGEKICGVKAMKGDRSIWATSVDQPSYHSNHYSGEVKNVCFPQDVPRGYLRIIPAGWKDVKPHPNDIEKRHKAIPEQEKVRAVERNDFGRCREGFVDLRIVGGAEKLKDNDPPVGGNAAMWFKETGEYWIIHGSAISLNNTLKFLWLMNGWGQALRAGMKVLDSLGAEPMRRVEAGLVKIRKVPLPSEDPFEGPRGTCEKEISISRQQDNWDDEPIGIFLNDASNKIHDCYGLPPLDRADFERKLDLSR